MWYLTRRPHGRLDSIRHHAETGARAITALAPKPDRQSSHTQTQRRLRRILRASYLLLVESAMPRPWPRHLLTSVVCVSTSASRQRQKATYRLRTTPVVTHPTDALQGLSPGYRMYAKVEPPKLQPYAGFRAVKRPLPDRNVCRKIRQKSPGSADVSCCLTQERHVDALVRVLEGRRRGSSAADHLILGCAGQADAGTRTPDPFITSEVLYQLSYVGAIMDASDAAAGPPAPPASSRRTSRTSPRRCP